MFSSLLLLYIVNEQIRRVISSDVFISRWYIQYTIYIYIYIRASVVRAITGYEKL